MIIFTSPLSAELLALQDLYAATDGANWLWKYVHFTGIPWNFTGGVLTHNPCVELWQGIECDCMTEELQLQYRHPNHIYSNLTTLPYAYTYFYDDGLYMEDDGSSAAANNYTFACHINKLDLIGYGMSGIVPSSFQDLSYLTHIHLQHNYELTGPILSYIIPHMPKMRVLNIAYNQFTGTIPASISSLSDILLFYISHNHMAGRVPKGIQLLPKLAYLVIDANLFTGALDDIIGEDPPAWFESLLFLDVEVNAFTGTIPVSIQYLTNVAFFLISGQYLTGSLPTELCLLSTLPFFGAYQNYLSGSLPNCMPSSMQYLYLDENLFSQSLPSAYYINTPSSLLEIDLDNNHLTGSIGSLPFSATISSLAVITMNGNRLTGTIPDWIYQSTTLLSLLLQDNKLTGPLISSTILDHVNASSIFLSSYLSNIDLSGNQLTGELPAELFNLPELASISLVSNCLYQENVHVVAASSIFPQSMCSASKLTSIVLNSMNSNNCPQQGKRRKSSSQQQYKQTGFTILPCLLSLPSLQVLSLAGIGLHGQLPYHQPDVSNFSSVLVNLSFSYNLLSGTIPVSYQGHRWQSLDLSYNKLSGTLASNFTVIEISSSSSDIGVNVIRPAKLLNLPLISCPIVSLVLSQLPSLLCTMAPCLSWMATSLLVLSLAKTCLSRIVEWTPIPAAQTC